MFTNFQLKVGISPHCENGPQPQGSQRDGPGGALKGLPEGPERWSCSMAAGQNQDDRTEG